MPGNQKFTNNASSTIVAALDEADLTFTVQPGEGDLFPAIAGAQFFVVTLNSPDNTLREIVKVTARAGDVFTVLRGQEGTPAVDFPINSFVQLRATAQAFDNIYTYVDDQLATLDVSALEARITTAEGEIDALQAADVALDTRLDTAETEIDALQAADVALDARLDTAETEIDALQAADVALDTRLDTAEGEIDALQAADVALDARLDTAEADIVALETKAKEYHIGLSVAGKPPANAVILVHPFRRSVSFAAAMSGSVGKSLVAATAQTDFDVRLDGVSVGTIRWAAAGTVPSFIAAAGFQADNGEYMTVHAPAVQDATLENLGVTLYGEKV